MTEFNIDIKIGLSEEEAKARLNKYGPNEIEEKKDASYTKISFIFLGNNAMNDRSSCRTFCYTKTLG